jgi:hypothetical protein
MCFVARPRENSFLEAKREGGQSIESKMLSFFVTLAYNAFDPLPA